jgi:hypothetical protein
MAVIVTAIGAVLLGIAFKRTVSRGAGVAAVLVLVIGAIVFIRGINLGIYGH